MQYGTLLKVKLPYDPVCPSVRWFVGPAPVAWSVFLNIISLNGGKFHFHAPIGALVLIRFSKVWMEGDNSAAPRDSRTFGAVPLGKKIHHFT